MKKVLVDLPEHVLAKTLASGATAYYWNLPSWARGRVGAPVTNEALGQDPVTAFARARELNQTLADWRCGADDEVSANKRGTINWLRDWFLEHPKVTSKSPKTQRFYTQGINLLCNHVLDTGRRVGSFQARVIGKEDADLIYERLKINDKGETRLRAAAMAMTSARRCWALALRRDYVSENPFLNMELQTSTQATAPATRVQLDDFTARADKMGHPSMALAAHITFELIQREVDVISRLSWSHLQGQTIKVIHHKTGKQVILPLYDDQGCLFPELVKRIGAAKRRGTLLIMRDKPIKRKGQEEQYVPYKEDHFRKVFRAIADAAGLPKDFTFLSLRHGGMTEMGDAELTDQQITSISTRTRQVISTYVHGTLKQRALGLRKRRAFITETTGN